MDDTAQGQASRPFRRIAAAGAGLAVVIALYALSTVDYLVFHTLVEAAHVLVALGTFTVAWYARHLLRGNYMLVLGVGNLYVAALYTLHALTYKGMGVLPVDELNVATQFWLLAAGVECAVFLLALAAPARTHRPLALHLGFGAAALVGTASILLWPVFPDAFVAGAGLTPFKIAVEYVIIAGYAAVLGLLWLGRGRLDATLLRYLAVAVAVRIVAEACFTLYTDVYGLANMAGHLLKAVACYFVFRAVVETGMVRPQALMTRALEREQELAAEVARQARTFDAILSATPDAVLMVDPGLRFVYANPAAAALFGIPRDRWPGRTWRDLGLPVSVMEPMESRARAVIADGAPRAASLRLDGRTYDQHLTPLHDLADGEPGRAITGVLLVARDVTDRVDAESRLRTALGEQERLRRSAERANAAKTRFLAAASHDLRQPVQALLLFADTLYERLDGHSSRGTVDTMRKALDALKALLDGLLDISRLEAGVVVPRVEPVSLASLLQRMQAEYASRFAEKGLRLRVAPSAAWVASDPTLLSRIVRNLLENALRYTSSGGVVLGCRRRGGVVRLEVLDSGPGIPRDRLDDIFEEFVQIDVAGRESGQGLGLGLAIVRRLADLLDHPLEVRSSPGRGSRFVVTVPQVRAPAEAPEDDARELPPAGVRGTALVVDDEAIVLAAMASMLESWGFRVLPAATPDAALAAVAAAGRAPDVVISDYRLGGGRTGVDLIREVRAACGVAVPSILLTGDTGPDRLVEAQRSGFDVLHKPVTPAQLRAVVEAVRQGTDAAVIHAPA
ncbi:MASE3 domain-containing protein [Azospirillum halopraeferens]|uniref:MASE3 domain-containing protein n=1 Tax=Azospirillum halopraeferens TaxID=34010 RepID=UPI000402AD3C|nr:MASE3 domain-containing protein [Azospirillum halopraeferens]